MQELGRWTLKTQEKGNSRVQGAADLKGDFVMRQQASSKVLN
jgi:hypothetical protein